MLNVKFKYFSQIYLVNHLGPFGLAELPVSYLQDVQMGSFHPEPIALSE